MNDQYSRTRRAADRTSRAFIAGTVHATIFLVLGGFAWSAGTLRDWRDSLPFAYGALVLALAFATGRRSRLAAVLLLTVTLWTEGMVWMKGRSYLSLAMLIVFGPIYALGLVGAIAWHRAESQRAGEASESLKR